MLKRLQWRCVYCSHHIMYICVFVRWWVCLVSATIMAAGTSWSNFPPSVWTSSWNLRRAGSAIIYSTRYEVYAFSVRWCVARECECIVADSFAAEIPYHQHDILWSLKTSGCRLSFIRQVIYLPLRLRQMRCNRRQLAIHDWVDLLYTSMMSDTPVSFVTAISWHFLPQLIS